MSAVPQAAPAKPILCLDFDGVCHLYSSGWKGAAVIPDPAVPGLFEFLEDACQYFDIHIFSSRSHQPGGLEAMQFWFVEQRRLWREAGGKGSEILTLTFPTEKPPALVTLDDRALTFTGTWPDAAGLRHFQPWNKVSDTGVVLQPHQARLVLERRELDARLFGLRSFIGTPAFLALPSDEQRRMHRQEFFMGEYLLVLVERIEAFRRG